MTTVRRSTRQRILHYIERRSTYNRQCNLQTSHNIISYFQYLQELVLCTYVCVLSRQRCSTEGNTVWTVVTIVRSLTREVITGLLSGQTDTICFSHISHTSHIKQWTRRENKPIVSKLSLSHTPNSSIWHNFTYV